MKKLYIYNNILKLKKEVKTTDFNFEGLELQEAVELLLLMVVTSIILS